MRHAIVVPAGPADGIPQGAALVSRGRGQFLMNADPGARFGERCARALRQQRTVPLPQVTEIGWFDDVEGEVRLNRQGAAVLAQWIGRRPYRNDLEAQDNRSDRRSRARRLTMQGRLAEAYRIDRRFGL